MYMQTDTRMTNSIFYIIMLFYINEEKKRKREIGETESITVYFTRRRLQGFRNLAKLFLIVRFLRRLSFRSRVTTTQMRIVRENVERSSENSQVAHLR